MTRKTILLVDDSQTAITFEKMVLGKGPYDFLAALEWLERNRLERLSAGYPSPASEGE